MITMCPVRNFPGDGFRKQPQDKLYKSSYLFTPQQQS